MDVVDSLMERSNESPLANRRSLSDDVVDRLRAAIVRGVFTPGQRLSEAALADIFRVSRGPIREAFALLEREGLLKLERHRGARVTSLSMADINEIYPLRVALERLAIDRACTLATAADIAALREMLERLRDAVDREDVFAVVECDVGFHDLIYVAAKHQRLYQSWSLLRPQIETFLFSRSMDQRDYLGKAVHEHTAMLAIIQSQRRLEAVALIEDHIHSAYERLARLSSAVTDPPSSHA